MKVEIYTKPGCHLCDDAIELFEDLRERVPFELLLHNILTDDGWFALYRYDVPVIFIDGVRSFSLRVTAEEAETAIRRALVRKDNG